MMMPSLPIDLSVLGAVLSAWLLTYLIHSTILLLLAWIVTRVFRNANTITNEMVWRVAVLGGIVTATIAVTLPGERALHEFTLISAYATPSTDSATVIETPLASLSEPLTAGPQLQFDLGAMRAELELTEANASASSFSVDPSIETSASGEDAASWLRTLQLIWLPLLGVLGAVWAVVSIAVAHDRLRRRLRGRVAIDDDDVLSMLSELQEMLGFRRRVRLWKSSGIDVPMAYGTFRPGICVPTRFLTDLSLEHQNRVLAHELAHLIRRDPLWVGAYRLIACMCFFQPLNWFALRRLRELAEYECDRIAVDSTGGRFGFARCLTEVANWLVADHSSVDRWKTAAMVSSMARSRSNLRQRIERLVYSDSAFVSPKRPRRLFVVFAFALIGLAMTALSPRVRAVAVDAKPESEMKSMDVVASSDLEDGADINVLIRALSEIAQEIDGIAVDIKSLSQRIDLLEGGSASNQPDELMASLERHLWELRAQRHGLLQSILNQHSPHQTSTEDVQ